MRIVFDQKPFHINEAGSKCAYTLTHKGELEIPLKEQHSETRERWTVNTMVTSREASARIGPPLGVVQRWRSHWSTVGSCIARPGACGADIAN
mgnify:CR=1 FL=1